MIRRGASKQDLFDIPTCVRVQATRLVPEMAEDVRTGLLVPPRSLPPKYFYDDHGSWLFDRICETDEYYPTRTEDELLLTYGNDIIAAVLPEQIIEFGSGSSRKTRRLFKACEEQGHICTYAPFDVCSPALGQAASDLKSKFQWLPVTPLVGDYHAGLGNLPTGQGTSMFLFLGGTIGNFSDLEVNEFITEIRQIMRPGDYFLLGADRAKDTGILNAAYNDSRGLTAEFNLNVLRVLNRSMHADFDLNYFDHHAVYEESASRIEMYLISRKQQEIHLKEIGETISLDKGDRILTEISRKFHYAELESILQENGLNIVSHFQPDNRYFSLVLSRLD